MRTFGTPESRKQKTIVGAVAKVDAEFFERVKKSKLSVVDNEIIRLKAVRREIVKVAPPLLKLGKSARPMRWSALTLVLAF